MSYRFAPSNVNAKTQNQYGSFLGLGGRVSDTPHGGVPIGRLRLLWPVRDGQKQVFSHQHWVRQLATGTKEGCGTSAKAGNQKTRSGRLRQSARRNQTDGCQECTYGESILHFDYILVASTQFVADPRVSYWTSPKEIDFSLFIVTMDWAEFDINCKTAKLPLQIWRFRP